MLTRGDFGFQSHFDSPLILLSPGTRDWLQPSWRVFPDSEPTGQAGSFRGTHRLGLGQSTGDGHWPSVFGRNISGDMMLDRPMAPCSALCLATAALFLLGSVCNLLSSPCPHGLPRALHLSHPSPLFLLFSIRWQQTSKSSGLSSGLQPAGAKADALREEMEEAANRVEICRVPPLLPPLSLYLSIGTDGGTLRESLFPPGHCIKT